MTNSIQKNLDIILENIISSSEINIKNIVESFSENLIIDLKNNDGKNIEKIKSSYQFKFNELMINGFNEFASELIDFSNIKEFSNTKEEQNDRVDNIDSNYSEFSGNF